MSSIAALAFGISLSVGSQIYDYMSRPEQLHSGSLLHELKKHYTYIYIYIYEYVHGAVDWVDVQRQRKWRLAGVTARHSDARWSTRLLSWQPWFRMSPKREVGRPKKRWDDDLAQLAGGAWPHEAKDAAFWKTLETGYIDRCR